MQELQKQILEKIKMEQEISPFLFIGKNRELLSSQIENLALSILKELNIPKNYLFTLKDNQEKIKISEIKNFLANTKLKSSYKIQIFFIENITSLTLEASNSCLKIFEEPGKQNLIFLQADSESSILDTILSRVQIIKLSSKTQDFQNNFFVELINNYLKGDNNLIKYFFGKKLEKQEYSDFLNTLLIFGKKNNFQADLLEELQEDIESVQKNNVLVRNVCDKWILKIR